MEAMKKFALLTLLAALPMFAADVADAIKAADKAWAVATVNADDAALNKMLADDLSYVHSTGDMDTKKQFIENQHNGVRKYLKIEHESMDVRVYGNAAVLTGTIQLETLVKGTKGGAHVRIIHVWVKQGGTWKLAAHQSLRLAN